MLNPYHLQEIIKSQDIVRFINEVLGLPTHEGQEYWLRNGWKPINILKPANQWGKTTIEAAIHAYHLVCKPQLNRFNLPFDKWKTQRYETLNFGKTYEIAKGVMEHFLDIVEGKYLLPDGTTNNSLLAGWAIQRVDDMPRLPQIVMWNNSRLLIRSYDGLGESFKRKRLTFISGDECGDIPELRLFLNGTLLPRLFFYRGSVHLVGTSQPKGIEYEELAEEAEREMVLRGNDSDLFAITANNNPKMAQIYQNKFMPEDQVKRIENIADPELKKQIIYGQYVDWANHLYSFDEVNQMFDDYPYDKESGFSEAPIAGEHYIFWVDMAAGDDETSCTCIRYNIKKPNADGSFTQLPHRVVFHKAWKGKSLPLTLQYEMIKQYFLLFKNVSPNKTKFGYDAASLGGKNTEEAFKEFHGFPFPPKGRSAADVKAELFGKVKETLGRGRKFRVAEDGKLVDENPDWGGIRASRDMKELRRQIEAASKDDSKLKNDQFMSFGMCLHFIESRAIKITHTKAVDFNYSRAI